ncbi:phage tail tube protein [Cytobacillus sp. NCCP-133]|uniref:phage tail tube protein n=1 Tax=Cytobacillus sp. NCCP-133 TaxID=766848 RepID=UPI00222EB0C8|nr:phage tail tube protein [Cytobacillus sp. NCCP-133]GLB58676.1 hypothetical protein NCCP133_08090 [Cytobacillus sp. NCCP-133]
MSNICRYVGLSKETSYNMASNPPEAKHHIDIASSSMDITSDKFIEVPTGLNRTLKQTREGFSSAGGNIVYPLDVNTIPFVLGMALGEYQYTQGLTVEDFNTFEFWRTKDSLLPSFVSRIGKDLFEHIFTGCVAEGFDIAVSDVITATVNVVAAQGQKTAIKSEEALNLFKQYPLAFHEVTAMYDGVDKSNLIKDFSLSFSNGVSVDTVKTIGSKHPTSTPVSGRGSATVSTNLKFVGTEEIEKYENGTIFKVEYFFDNGADGFIHIILPAVQYTSVPTTVSGQDEIVQGTAFKALEGTVTLANGTTVNTDIFVKVSNKLGEEEIF